MKLWDRFRIAFGAKALTVNTLQNSMEAPDSTGFHAARDLTADDLRGSSVVAAPLLFVEKAFRMLRPYVALNGEEVESHALAVALSDRRLIGALADNYFRCGNAYLGLTRLSSRAIDTMQFRPASRMKPKWTPTAEVYFEWYPPGPTQRRVTVLPEELAHIRYGIDPDNPALGCSPLSGALAEIATDLEAAGFSSAILQNLGVMGVMISVDETDTVLTDKQIDVLKAKVDATIKGSRRGSSVVMRGKTSLSQIKPDLSGADLAPIRNISEERVCAALGIHPAVIGFGTGLQQTRVGATMSAVLRAAWTDTILPAASDIGGQLGAVLLPEFGADPERGYTLEFDSTGVEALNPNRLDETRRFVMLTQGLDPIISTEAARRELGFSDEDAPQEAEPPEPPDPPEPPTPAVTDGQLAAMLSTKQEDYQHDMIRRIDRAFGGLAANMERDLAALFSNLGEDLARVAGERLTEKQDVGMELDVIMEAASADIALASQRMDGAYTRAYGATLHQAYEDAAAVIGISIGVPDPEELRILAMAGTRRGLVDLTAQTRARLFTVLEESRAESLGVNSIVPRIREEIPQGPWRSTQVRARTIARTEVKHAQRISTLSAYRTSGRVDRVLIFDARLGRTDAECEARDGTTVTFQEAEQIANDEHPNGSADYAPVIA